MARVHKKQHEYLIPRSFEKVGAYLQEMRIRTGLTQREVSQALGYSSSQFISNFERGIALPPIHKLKTLIKLYRMDSNEVIRLIMDCRTLSLKDELKK